jgi:hypothetical protein
MEGGSMMKPGRALGIVTGVLLLVATATVASAHSTGNERRTGATCDALYKDPKYGPNEAAWCHTCIDGMPQSCGGLSASPPSKACHYHPGDPAGTRCRPDNGKP